jgi:hypothetical protein
MGTWGAGAFENDSVSDWVYELEEQNDTTILLDALTEAAETDEYLDVDEGDIAVACAEIVAALNGHPAQSLPDNVVEYINRVSPPGVEMTDLALRALERVKADNSELKELWDESDSREEWFKSLADLEARLGKPPITRKTTSN